MKRTKKSDQECQINSELTINKLSYSGTESTDWSAPNLEDFGIETNRWSDLSQSERARVAGHFLIGTSRADDFGELKFPVVNPSNGNLNERALRAVISGRGAQIEGISADKRAAARRRAYNLLNEEFDAELEIPENLEAAGEKCHTLQVNVSDGYMELMQKLRDKIDSLDNELRVNFLEDFDNEKLVYRVANREAGGDSYYRRSYTVSDDGTVGLGDDIEQVNKKVDVTWNPIQSQAQNINQNSGGVSMNKKTDEQKQNEQGCCPEKVEAVINAEVNDFTEDDRETLQAMSEEVIDKIPVKEPEPATNQNQQEQQMDFDTLLQNADSELRQSIERGRELYRQERQGMVQRILDNSSQFTQEELDQMDHAMLQKVANSIKPAVNYKGAGGAPVNSQEELEEGIGMPWLQQVETAKQQ